MASFPPGDEGLSVTSPPLRRVRRAAAAMPLLLLTLSACGGDDTVLDGVDGSVRGTTTEVQLPTGRLTLTVSDAGEVRRGDLTDAGSSPSGSYVGIDWDFEPWGGIPDSVTGFLISQERATIRVKVDGTTYDLGDADEAAARYVPADDGVDAADVALSVTFDGVTQQVRGDGSDLSPGLAAPLYDLSAPADRRDACDIALQPASLTGTPSCRASMLRLPYVGELGWAEAGTTWLVVAIGAGVDEIRQRGDDAGREVIGQERTVTLDGEAPVRELTSRTVGSSLDTQVVFAAADDGVPIVQFQQALTTRPALDVPAALVGRVREQP